MIDDRSIQTLKNQLNIVDVVGHYIELKKSGSGYKCVCPFHNDTTPSMNVSPSKNIYHCFACGAGGDGIKFVMEYEKLNYPEAIEKLASIFNFTLTYTQNRQVKEEKKILEGLNLFYVQELERNIEAKEYLKNRGIFDSMVEKVQIGYAPHSNATLDFLKAKYISMSEAKEVGVADIGEGNRAYARFHERITFPIYSYSGKVVGFGGRTTSNHPAKYVNSPQTKLFNKSALLYGYNFAKESIYKNSKIIITEGYLDVIMLHQAGFSNAVATLGTALTNEHLPLIRRGEPEVILSYDGDNAGIAAALKASKLLSHHNIKGGVVIFGEGLDPADMVQKGKLDELNKLFSNPKPFVEFFIEQTIKSYNLKNPLEKKQALESVSEFLQTLPNIISSAYISLATDMLGVKKTQIKLKRERIEAKANEANDDFLELTIIKTALLSPTLVDAILDVIDVVMFKTHQKEFQDLINQNYDTPELRRILIWDDVKSYTEDELKGALRIFLMAHYTNELDSIKANLNLDYEKKKFLLRKVQEIIFKLKKGDFVSYESIGTI